MKLIILLALINSAQAAINFQSASGKTNFEAIGKPAMIKIKGESAAPKTTLVFDEGKTSLEAELLLDQFTTGIGLRDEHMKETYLETKKHPTAKLIIPSLNIPADWEKNPTDLAEQEFTGTLNLHGKEAPVKGKFTMNSKQEANAEFQIKLTDFDIEIPDYLGIKVAELVTVKTQIQFEKK